MTMRTFFRNLLCIIRGRRGAPVTIGGKTYLCPTLTVGVWRALHKDGHFDALYRMELAAKSDAPDESVAKDIAAGFDATIAIVSAALSVNYPYCTPEWVSERVKFEEAGRILGIVLAAGGFKTSDASREGNGGPKPPSP